MIDPFEVLGLAPGASDEQVRDAYRELARRYSDAGSMPDPARMREIDTAYDEIILGRTGNGGTSYSEPTYTYTVPNDLGDIRAKIKSGKIDDAETLLDGVPVSNRTAEWYYLKGTVQHRRGWLEEAARNFEQATRLEPSNAEYARAYNSINSDRSGGYRTERGTSGKSGCSGCDICSGLLCADCCCECMGGDLIRCC
ncbi:MAG: molecular chaperone DnaJ [Clostridia bacterium]|nr:molecular chaperone DnaJ [Clostridia bacterium]